MTRKKKTALMVVPKPRHADSVIRDDDDDGPPAQRVITVNPEMDPAWELEEEDGEELVQATRPTSPSVHTTARHLILQAKEAMSKRGHHPVHVTLVLEDAEELEAALMLEHQGRGHLSKEGADWVFEFNEEGAMGGILRGDVLQNKD
jgi:hypothetical protein